MKFSSTKLMVTILLLAMVLPNGIAQLGYSSAAMGMAKMNARAGMLPLPDQVIVEEYFNYHKHDLISPDKGESIAIDISKFQAADKSMILQIGLSTGTISNLKEVPAVNVSLVIDRSGSMSGDRIQKAKEAAIEFVSRLREKDFLSIVLFDDQIEVLIPAQKVINKGKIIDKIRSIEVRGSTDLNGGILKGYSEVFKHYKKEQNNKVIVLTDAITNTGIVDPMQIVKGSNRYKVEHEIDITMVGVGVDFNNSLSRQISTSNRSSIFFINDAADIKKVFIDEIESLLSPVANDARITIELSTDLEIEKCFGYSPQIVDQKITLDLEKMNSGLTQVFLFKIKPKNSAMILEKEGDVKVKLDYFDIASEKTLTIEQSVNIVKREFDNRQDVRKNYCIARMAQCIKDIAVLAKAEDYKEAKYRAGYILKSTQTYYPEMVDVDVKRVFDILQKYELIIKEHEPDKEISSVFPY